MSNRAIEWAADEFEKCLAEDGGASDAIPTLMKLGVSEESIRRHGIGFSPADGDWLLNRAADRFSLAELRFAGLVAGDNDNLADRFTNRIIVPVCDQWGVTIGFYGVPVSASAAPRLTPNSVRFRRNRALFNLHHAKESILSSRTVYVVEDPIDAILATQTGLANVVATFGGLTNEQEDVLFRLANEIRFIAKAADRRASTDDGIMVFRMPPGGTFGGFCEFAARSYQLAN